MGTVHISIGHDHDVVVAGPFLVEFLTDAGADCGDERLDFSVL